MLAHVVLGFLGLCSAHAQSTLALDSDTYVSIATSVDLRNRSNFGAAVNLLTNGEQHTAWGAARALLKLDHTQIVSTAQNIRLRLYGYEGDTRAGYDAKLQVRRLTNDWLASTVTWDTKPGFDTTVYAEKVIQPNAIVGWHEWDLTALVKAWQRGDFPNYGVMLYSTSSGSGGGWRNFVSSDDATRAAFAPQIAWDPGVSTLLEDTFDGTQLNASLWKQTSASRGENTVGVSSTVHDGYLDLRMDQTDNGGQVVTRFEPQQNLRVTLTHSMHAAGPNFMPVVYLESAVGQLLVSLSWKKSNWAPDYCSLPANFDRVLLTIGSNICAAVSSVAASSFYDRWSTSVLDYNMLTGLITVDLDNDGTIDLQATLPVAERLAATGLSMHGFGWYTGHWHRVDSIKIEGTPQSSSGASPITPAAARLDVPQTFTLTGTGFTSGMAFTLEDCEPESGPGTIPELGTGSATQRSFRCVPRLPGPKLFSLKTTAGGTVLLSGSVTVDHPARLGNAGTRGIPAEQGVSLWNGNVHLAATDLAVPGKGMKTSAGVSLAQRPGALTGI